jgi:hypothetical protein
MGFMHIAFTILGGGRSEKNTEWQGPPPPYSDSSEYVLIIITAKFISAINLQTVSLCVSSVIDTNKEWQCPRSGSSILCK